MREQPFDAAVRHLRGLVAGTRDAETSDPELLQRFTNGRDEAAFAALVRRHGPMVREVCRRLLGQVSDVEDASQVVFLVLACKAGSIRRRRSLAGWLYGIAYRTALRARRDAARRKGRESRAAARTPSDPVRESIRRELCEVIDAELFRLPEDQRAAVVLCYLEGRTRDEAARQLGQSVRTLDRQLQRGRELLRRRLARRGVTLSAALLSLGLSQDLARAAAARSAAGIPHEVSPEVVALMKGVLRTMLWTRIKIVSALMLTLTLMGTAAGVLAFRATAQDTVAQSQPPSPAAPAKAAPEPDVYALVLIEDGEPRLLPDSRRVAAAEGDPSVFRRTQAVLLKSRLTVRAALKRDEVNRLAVVKRKADPERWLVRNLETTFLDNTGVMRVSFGEGSPEEKAVLINAIVDAYMDDIVYAEQRRKENRVADLDRVLQESADRLQTKKKSLRALAANLGKGAKALQRQAGLTDLALFRKELLRVRLEKAGTAARLNHRKSTGRGNTEAVAKLQEEGAVLAEQEKMLEKDIAAREEQAARIASDEADRRASLRSFQDEIAAEEQFHSELARRVKTSQIELRARPRAYILQKAEVSKKDK